MSTWCCWCLLARWSYSLQFSTQAGSSHSHLTPASDLRASVFGRSGLAEHGSVLFFLKCCHLCVMDFRFWMPFLNNGPRGTIYSVQVKNKPENKNNEFAFSALTLLVGRQEEHLAYKNWVMSCWCGYLSGPRCRLFAYVQLMPLHPKTPSFASFKSRLVLPFW